MRFKLLDVDVRSVSFTLDVRDMGGLFWVRHVVFKCGGVCICIIVCVENACDTFVP